MRKKLERVTVDRANWWNGSRTSAWHFTSGLCMDKCTAGKSGQMCCLGFWGNQIQGWSKRRMLNKGEPYELDADLMTRNFSKLMQINDNTNITNEAREARLKEEGRKQGILFKFIGKHPERE